MITFNKLSESEKKELKSGVIQVYGKAMNRTALGIVDAFFTLNPDATFQEVKDALPDLLNPSGPIQVKTLFAPFNKGRLYGVIQPGSIRQEYLDNDLVLEASHFTKDDEIFMTSDGIEVLVSSKWESKDTMTGENDLQVLTNHVLQHGIRVVESEPKQAFKKGKYQLEIINPVLFQKMTDKVVPVVKEPKKNLMWLWSILLLIAITFVYFTMTRKADAAASLSPVVEKSIIKVESNPVVRTEIEKLKSDITEGVDVKNREITFSNILFKYNSDEILHESEADLKTALDLLIDLKELKISIEGHTSAEGSDAYNLELSQKRAIAVKNYLLNNGISTDRMKTEGKGKSEPITKNDTEENKQMNRRIVFNVLGN